MKEAESLSRALSYNMYYAGKFPFSNVIGDNSPQAEPYNFEDTTVAMVNNDMSIREGSALATHTSKLNNTTGITNLTSQINAQIPYKYIPHDNWRLTYNYRDAVNQYYTNYNKKPKEWKEGTNYWHVFTDKSQVERRWGVARYEDEYGTEFLMKVSGVSKSNTPVLVKNYSVI